MLILLFLSSLKTKALFSLRTLPSWSVKKY